MSDENSDSSGLENVEKYSKEEKVFEEKFPKVPKLDELRQT